MNGLTVTRAAETLFFRFVSVAQPLSLQPGVVLTVLTVEPVCLGIARTMIVAVWPDASRPRSHVNGLVLAHVPCDGFADSTWSGSAEVSVSIASGALSGPSF